MIFFPHRSPVPAWFSRVVERPGRIPADDALAALVTAVQQGSSMPRFLTARKLEPLRFSAMPSQHGTVNSPSPRNDLSYRGVRSISEDE